MPPETPAPKSRVFRSSEQVFCYFREKYGFDGDGDMNAIGLFAFALVEKDRVDWYEHSLEISGSPPNHAQTDAWFRDKPDSYFKAIEDRANKWFYGFAELMLQDRIEEEKKAAVSEALGNIGRFWPGFWVGNLIGVTSNIAFTLLVVLFVVVVNSDFSFIAWSKRIFGYH